jgi:hypothetical protein
MPGSPSTKKSGVEGNAGRKSNSASPTVHETTSLLEVPDYTLAAAVPELVPVIAPEQRHVEPWEERTLEELQVSWPDRSNYPNSTRDSLNDAGDLVVQRFITPLLAEKPWCPRRKLIESLAEYLGETVDKARLDRAFMTDVFGKGTGIEDARLRFFTGEYAWGKMLEVLMKIRSNHKCSTMCAEIARGAAELLRCSVSVALLTMGQRQLDVFVMHEGRFRQSRVLRGNGVHSATLHALQPTYGKRLEHRSDFNLWDDILSSEPTPCASYAAFQLRDSVNHETYGALLAWEKHGVGFHNVRGRLVEEFCETVGDSLRQVVLQRQALAEKRKADSILYLLKAGAALKSGTSQGAVANAVLTKAVRSVMRAEVAHIHLRMPEHGLARYVWHNKETVCTNKDSWHPAVYIEEGVDLSSILCAPLFRYTEVAAVFELRNKVAVESHSGEQNVEESSLFKDEGGGSFFSFFDDVDVAVFAHIVQYIEREFIEALLKTDGRRESRRGSLGARRSSISPVPHTQSRRTKTDGSIPSIQHLQLSEFE